LPVTSIGLSPLVSGAAIRFDEPARPIAARVAAMAVRFIAEITSASTPVTVAVR
jgi:hypothetical protein